ncbi:MAG: DUF2299 family protein [Candidatus Odinarchaeota archaeon]
MTNLTKKTNKGKLDITKLEVEILQKSILNWITEDNLFLKSIKTDKDAFRYLIKFANINLEVFSPLNTDKLLIVAPIQIHPVHMQRLEQLNLDERFKFLTEIRLFFFDNLHDFKMVPRDPQNLNEHLFTSIVISEFLLGENLSRQEFLYRCRKVAFAAHGFIQRMYLKFGLVEEGTPVSTQRNIYT